MVNIWESAWPTALAPMQDVTGLPFMRIIANYGAPDLFFTEFFRVHEHSRLDPEILTSITENPSGKPVFAQLIGESVPELCRVADLLKEYPVAGVDLNMGCPAPRVYKKKVGGGLLKDPPKIAKILESLRSHIEGRLTVKMRIGFEDDSNFDAILGIIKDSGVDMLSLHTRTVLGGYRSTPNYSYAARAAEFLPCPVLLNGNVTTAQVALRLKEMNHVCGIMVGRSAIRNPWIFRQIRELQQGRQIYQPKMKELYQYISSLFESLKKPELCDIRLVARMKKFLNFVGLSVCPEGEFLHDMRRTRTSDQLFSVCSKYLLEDGIADKFMPLEPFEDLVARPSQESCQVNPVPSVLAS